VLGAKCPFGKEERMSTTGSPLRAGAARIDITPDLGIQLAGDIGRLRPVEEIRERLYASALAVESGGERACLLSVDLLSMGCDWADRIRREAAGRFGLRPEAILVHVVQNHAAPALGHLFLTGARTRFPAEYPWLMGGDDRYHAPTADRCVEAIGRAVANLEPAVLHAGRGIDGRVAFNRRFVMRDGTARCHPPTCDPGILHVEGPTDPEVAVATFTNADGKVIAALLHHTCHPCHGYPHRYVIGDWPGAWAELMRGHWGEGCVPLVVNGCCGNIHHRDHTNPDYRQDHLRMAGMLAETTLRTLDSLKPVAVERIDARRVVLSIPIRQLSEGDLSAAARLFEKHPEPLWTDEAKTSVDWDWVYAVTMLDLEDARRERPSFPYEVQVFRLGGLGLVGLMGEPFVEAQLEIKQASRMPHTFVAHFCNGYVGYVPTQRAFKGGGYETRTGAGSRLAPDALERITTAAIELLDGAP
jgi:neutral ceramidase